MKKVKPKSAHWVEDIPEEDDLERCNCEKAGQTGHMMCGWNSKVNLPIYMARLEE